MRPPNQVRSVLSRSRLVRGPVFVLGLGLALVFAGCGSESGPLAPEEPALSLDSTDRADLSAAGPVESGLIGGGIGGLLRAVTQLILPRVGGLLSADRYTLIVPPGALPRPTLYELLPLRDGNLTVELGPHGAQFSQPVTLSIDLRQTSLASLPPEEVTLYWWDEASREWVDVGGDYDPVTGLLTSQLAHFSRYRPGQSPRAGW